MNESNLEHVAESYVISQLTLRGVFVAKPYGDEWGADLLAMLSVYDYAKFIRIQSKGRSLNEKGRSSVTIPKHYVTDSFCLFLYIVFHNDKTYSNQEHLFILFSDEIKNLFTSKEVKGVHNYYLGFSGKKFSEILSPFKGSLERFEKVKKTIRNVQEIDPWNSPPDGSEFDEVCNEIKTLFRRASEFIKCDWNSWTSSSNDLFSHGFISENERQIILFLKTKRDEIIFSKSEDDELLRKFIFYTRKISEVIRKKLDKITFSVEPSKFSYFMGWFTSELRFLQRFLDKEDRFVHIRSLVEISKIMDYENEIKCSYAGKNLGTTKLLLLKLKQQISNLLQHLSEIDHESDAIQTLKKMNERIQEAAGFLEIYPNQNK